MNCQSLYNLKNYSDKDSFYLKEVPIENEIILSSSLDEAQKFYVQQNTIDPNFVMIHCSDSNSDLLTVNHDEKKDFLSCSPKKLDEGLGMQQFLIYKSKNYKEGKAYVYIIQYKDMYLTVKDKKLILQEKESDSYEGQEFEFTSLKGLKEDAPTKFLWDKIETDESGIPILSEEQTKILLEYVAPKNEKENDLANNETENKGKSDQKTKAIEVKFSGKTIGEFNKE
ncbi:hypothetical protein GVAV_002073 [Gurleya vavrai]